MHQLALYGHFFCPLAVYRSACNIIRRINIVGQCNKSDIVHWKDIIHILTDSDIVSSETAHVLADDKIDLSVFGILEQTLDARSLECQYHPKWKRLLIQIIAIIHRLVEQFVVNVNVHR